MLLISASFKFEGRMYIKCEVGGIFFNELLCAFGSCLGSPLRKTSLESLPGPLYHKMFLSYLHTPMSF